MESLSFYRLQSVTFTYSRICDASRHCLCGRPCRPMQHPVNRLPLLPLEHLCADGEINLVPILAQGEADANQAFWWEFCDGLI